MTILSSLILVFLILNILIFYLPKFLDKIYSLLFKESPSKRTWFLTWALMGLLYFVTIFKLYTEINSNIKYRIQSEEYV